MLHRICVERNAARRVENAGVQHASHAQDDPLLPLGLRDQLAETLDLGLDGLALIIGQGVVLSVNKPMLSRCASRFVSAAPPEREPVMVGLLMPVAP